MDTPISIFWNALTELYFTIANGETMKRFWHLNPHVYKNETAFFSGKKSLEDNCLYESNTIREWF